MTYKTTIKKDGPFFQGDPAKKFQANVEAMMKGYAEAGEADVIGQLRSGEGGRAEVSHGVGRVSDYVHGRVASLNGKHWHRTAVVSVNNHGLSREQGIALMAAAASLEARFHAFRKAKARLGRAKAANIDLLKGLR